MTNSFLFFSFVKTSTFVLDRGPLTSNHLLLIADCSNPIMGFRFLNVRNLIQLSHGTSLFLLLRPLWPEIIAEAHPSKAFFYKWKLNSFYIKYNVGSTSKHKQKRTNKQTITVILSQNIDLWKNIKKNYQKHFFFQTTYNIIKKKSIMFTFILIIYLGLLFCIQFKGRYQVDFLLIHFAASSFD